MRFGLGEILFINFFSKKIPSPRFELGISRALLLFVAVPCFSGFIVVGYILPNLHPSKKLQPGALTTKLRRVSQLLRGFQDSPRRADLISKLRRVKIKRNKTFLKLILSLQYINSFKATNLRLAWEKDFLMVY